MAHRYFCDKLLPTDTSAVIDSAEAHHIACVLRAKIGDELTLCDGKGYDYKAKITDIGKDFVRVEINTCVKSVSEPDVAVTIYAGYPKLDKLELIVQKATELGAVTIVPFYSKNCVVTQKKYKIDKADKQNTKTDRLNKIALEAAKQSARAIVPNVCAPLQYKEMIEEAIKNDVAIFLYENEKAGENLHSRLCDGVKTIALITGSEGGFTPQEVQFASDSGCKITGLGPRILRCETAPIAALAAIMALTGNLQ